MSFQRSAILRKLRPPFIQATKVVYPYRKATPTNLGLTLQVVLGQPIVAAGDGIVDLIAPLKALWQNDLGTINSVVVRIDHGLGIKTLVHGLTTITAQYGPVSRGQLLGYAAQTQVFFTVEYDSAFQDPTRINQHLGLMSGSLGFQKEGHLRQAPDLITTTVTLIQSLLWHGIRYFIPLAPVPVLFNLDFNGQGNKTGPARIGFSPSDVWNAVTALDFAPIPVAPYYGYCAGGVTFPAAMGLFLNDYHGSPTKVFLERDLLTASSGVASFFDPMLNSWVGGYTGVTPKLNSFTVRNLPKGTYDVYVYANGGTTSDPSTVYTSVNGGAPLMQTINTTGATGWVENGNYVHTQQIVPPAGQLIFVVYGYLSGIQLLRTAA